MRDSMTLLYGTRAGRCTLRLLLWAGLPRAMAAFLRSPLSRPLVPLYIKKHRIDMTGYDKTRYRTFADFFARRRMDAPCAVPDEALISPCDGLLSVLPVDESSAFALKGSRYRLCDLIGDAALAARYIGGTCLIFRLTANDYHHYVHMDSGFVHESHFVEGQLHSVQPIACATYPVFRLNRRCWTQLDTDHFGTVTQIEIGALAVGGIRNAPQGVRVKKGDEKGYFELCGSTIVVLTEKGRVRLLPEIARGAQDGQELRVTLGMYIGDAA